MPARARDTLVALRPAAARLAAAAIVAAGIAFAALDGAPAARAAEPGPDFAFFKERIEPVLQAVCAQCHAGKGQGRFQLIVHAPGVPFPDTEHRVNFETVLKLLVPGKPEQSPFLLKPLAEKDGGVKHGGNDRIFKGTPAYTTWVQFIDGERGSSAGTSSPGSAPGQPDFAFFYSRIEPTLLGVCSRCHAGAGKGQFALITHVGGTPFPLADHHKNFETVTRLLVAGKPDQSKFLLKPLAERDGGVKHGGGDLINKGDALYRSWVDFIDGVKGPPLPEEAPVVPDPPTIVEKGLVIQAEDMKAVGESVPADLEGGQGKAVAPGASGARLSAPFRTGRTGGYSISLRMSAGVRGVRVRVDDGEYLDVESPRSGVGDVGPRLLLDGGKPLDARLGRLAVNGDAIQMDGRVGAARFLSPADLAHKRLEARIAVPAGDDPGRDDAWLLFDGQVSAGVGDGDNVKFFGLSDGGRRVVMGVIESAKPRILRSAPLPEGAPAERLGVDIVDGVAIGRLDGKPILFVNFDRGLGAGRFGFETHGVVTLKELVAKYDAEEVHRMKPGLGGVFNLRRGNHTLEVDLLPGSGALDAVTLKESTP